MGNKRDATEGAPIKKLIDYSRDYRRMSRPSVWNYAFAAYTAIPIVLVYLLFYRQISFALSQWAGRILASVTEETVSIVSKAYLPGLGNIHFLDIAGTTPSFTCALLVAMASIVLIIICSQINRNARPIMIYFCMGLYVLFFSALFFVFFPERFPYTLTQYSELYMKQQIAMWITISSLAGIAFGLLCERGGQKFVAFFIAVAVSFLCGCLRYVVYLYILHAASSLLMATMFFSFGVLFDFLKLICIFSIYSRGYSVRLAQRRGGGSWQWS